MRKERKDKQPSTLLRNLSHFRTIGDLRERKRNKYRKWVSQYLDQKRDTLRKSVIFNVRTFLGLNNEAFLVLLYRYGRCLAEEFLATFYCICLSFMCLELSWDQVPAKLIVSVCLISLHLSTFQTLSPFHLFCRSGYCIVRYTVHSSQSIVLNEAATKTI